MKIEIDEQKILTEILERDGSLHKQIKDRVESVLVEQVRSEIEDRFLDSSVWGQRVEEISDRILKNLEEQQTEMVKKILKDFYNGYRYKKDNLQILKKLKEFIGEN